MGQYHLTVNLDKKEFLMPHKLGVGLKLREQLGSSDSTPEALFILLACSNGYGGGDLQDTQNKMVGRWGGDKIAVVGDYAEASNLPMMFAADTIYSLCHSFQLECPEWGCVADATSHYLDITDMVIPVMELNNPRLKIDMESPGWRRKVYAPDQEEWDVQP
jgi:hypothetical protein